MAKSLSFRLLSAVQSLASWIHVQAEAKQYARTLKAARGTVFKPRPDDVYVVSYPKSGTTLMQMMVYQLTSGGEVDFPHIETVSPWYDLAILGGHAPLLEALPSPRLLKSHVLYEWLPRTGRFVYVARNVRDVAVSAYHHHCLITGVDHDLGTYLDDFLGKHQGLFGGSWFSNLASWWPHRHDDDVLFLVYDEVVRDLEGTARRVASFLGLTVDDATLARTLERCALGFMKEHDERFDPRRTKLDGTAHDGYLARNLAAGGGALDAGQARRLDAELQALAGQLGWADDDRDGRRIRGE